MKLFLKIFFLLMLITIIAGAAFYFLNNESLPEGSKGTEADQLAQQMMASVNKDAWDNIAWMNWTFRGAHDYLWDKKRDMVEVTWGENDENKVILHTKTKRGKAYTNGKLSEDPDKQIETAWSFFCNDSFWLNPVVKAFDPGTERSVVNLEDGRKGLKVSYTGGGVTPGDSYLWILDENNRPTAWKMWTKIIPIGGVEATWENWENFGGAQLSTKHLIKVPVKPLDLELTNIKAGNTFQEMGRTEDPFEQL